MQRMLAALVATALLAGCQARNPYAAFGPATVPPPGMKPPAPYYPSEASAAQSAGSGHAASSGKADGANLAGEQPHGTPPARLAADPSDAQPIRIVENPSPIRTATAPRRRAAVEPARREAPLPRRQYHSRCL